MIALESEVGVRRCRLPVRKRIYGSHGRYSSFLPLLPSSFSLSLRDSYRDDTKLAPFIFIGIISVHSSVYFGWAGERGNRLTSSPAMVKLKEFFLLGPAEAAGEDERLLKDLLASPSSSDKEGERRFFDNLPSPISVCGSHTASAVSFLSPF